MRRLPNHRGHRAVGRRLDHQRGRHGPAKGHFAFRAVLRLVAGRLGHPRRGRRGDVPDPPGRLRPNALAGRGRREPSFPRLDRMRSSRVLGARSPRSQRLLRRRELAGEFDPSASAKPRPRTRGPSQRCGSPSSACQDRTTFPGPLPLSGSVVGDRECSHAVTFALTRFRRSYGAEAKVTAYEHRNAGSGAPG